MNSDMWERTEDAQGHRPKFAIWCRFCDTDMVIRFSAIFPWPNHLHGFFEAGNQLAYKCPKCGNHVRFNVNDDKDYCQKIYELRGGKQHYHSLEEWEDNELIKKQLEGLGYWGGDRDDEPVEDEENDG